MTNTQLTAILAVFNVKATGRAEKEHRPLATYFDAFPNAEWAETWHNLGVPADQAPPPQPSLGGGKRWLGLIAGDFKG